MNQDIKEQWIAALRSGEYEQGKGRLATIREDSIVGYCCLGVLCDLAVKAGVAGKVHSGHGFYRFYNPDDSLDGNTAVLPQFVMEWAELKDSQGWVEIDERSLSSMNDEGKTFNEIAQVIEVNL